VKTANKLRTAVIFSLGMMVCLSLYWTGPVHGASAREIDIRVDAALEKFYQEVTGGKEFFKQTNGVLVFPKVLKAGFGIGGGNGEGALRIGGKTVEYYDMASASIGFQLGA
jgi:lipid-binding SYLF domain-containing protein